MNRTDERAAASQAELQRRTLNVTRVGVVPGGAAVASVVTVYTLMATDLLGSDQLAGLAGAVFTLGAATISIPLAAYMRRRGRRPGLVLALGSAAAGVATAAVGAELGWFVLYLAGLFVFGAGQAANYQARYVVVDLAPEADRGSAIGAVVWVSTLGAVIGPVVVPRVETLGESVGLGVYTGPFVFAAMLMAVSATIYQIWLRPDPLIAAGGVDPAAPRRRPLQQVRDSYGVIAGHRGAVLGVAAMAISQAVMVGVMTMTPPHMKDHGQATTSAYVIAVHIVGMYGFAPLVGRFVDRVGQVRAIQAGSVVLGSGCVLAIVGGYVPVLIFVGLFLLGLGWNIGLIGGTSLLNDSVPAASRVEAQGSGDLVLNLCSAAAAISSGLIKHATSFRTLSNVATVLAAVLLMWALFDAARTRDLEPRTS